MVRCTTAARYFWWRRYRGGTVRSYRLSEASWFTSPSWRDREEVRMTATVGELIEFLSSFDSSQPLRVLGVGGGDRSELIGFAVMDVLDPVVACDNGTPVVWLVARRQDGLSVEVLPKSVALMRSACGCMLEVPVVFDRPVATWAIECEHTSARSR
jgi:hypothetical protein